MTWQALVRLNDEAGAAIDALGKRLGVERAVAARIALMQWLEWQGRHVPRAYDFTGHDDPPVAAQEHGEKAT